MEEEEDMKMQLKTIFSRGFIVKTIRKTEVKGKVR